MADVEGVIFSVAGEVIAAGTYDVDEYDEDGRAHVTVLAEPMEGFRMDFEGLEGLQEWAFEFTFTNPIEAGPGEPTDPGAGEPTDPGAGEPTDPGAGEPTDPGAGDPTGPAPGDPTNPDPVNTTRPALPNKEPLGNELPRTGVVTTGSIAIAVLLMLIGMAIRREGSVRNR